MYMSNGYRGFSGLFGQREKAIARISGIKDYPDIRGSVRFYETPLGVLVVADISGLPMGEKCKEKIFGFHIHTGESCSGNEREPLADTLGHYDNGDCSHPSHSGDMPPLFGSDGYAFLSFLSNRFTVDEVIGRAFREQRHYALLRSRREIREIR